MKKQTAMQKHLEWLKARMVIATKMEKLEKDQELLIELEDWNHTCGDGCCHTYGTNIYMNGEQIEDEDGTSSQQLLEAVLGKLGYINVKVGYK